MTITNATAVIEVPTRDRWADWAGMIASIGCAIHCAAMPLVLAYLPTLGLGWLASEGFHRWMAVICFGLAAAAFVPGWRKHGSLLPAIWGGLGLFVLTTAAFGMEDNCCASCTTVSQVHSAASDVVCESCEATAGNLPSASHLSVPPLAPFMTPLGGLLLVVGHILNHRKSCVCQDDTCCLSVDSK